MPESRERLALCSLYVMKIYAAVVIRPCSVLTERSMREERIKLLELALAGATPPACYDVPRYREAMAYGTAMRHLNMAHSPARVVNSDGLTLLLARNM